MDITILHNDFDDCLMYVNGIAHSDIDYRWADCILWLKDVVKDSNLNIDIQLFEGHRKDFPDKIEIKF